MTLRMVREQEFKWARMPSFIHCFQHFLERISSFALMVRLPIADYIDSLERINKEQGLEFLLKISPKNSQKV